MSGAEVVLGSVGVVPVLVESIRVFKKIYRAIKTAKRLAKEVESAKIDFEIQQGRFLNESILILQLIGEDGVVSRKMVGDPFHEGWNSQMVEERMRDNLLDSYKLYMKILARVRNIQEEIYEQMRPYDIVRIQKAKVGTCTAISS